MGILTELGRAIDTQNQPGTEVGLGLAGLGSRMSCAAVTSTPVYEAVESPQSRRGREFTIAVQYCMATKINAVPWLGGIK